MPLSFYVNIILNNCSCRQNDGGDLMAEQADSEEKVIINVVDEFDAAIQGSGYNGNFKKWRKNKDNPYAFNFEKNSKEKIFNESRGFEIPSQTDEGKKVFGSIMREVGILMLIVVVFRSIIGKLTIIVLDTIGFNIHTTLFSSGVYGGGTEIIATTIILGLAALLMPMIYLHKQMKMPLKAGIMHTVRDSAEIIGSIGFAMILCTIACLPAAYSSETKDIYTYFSATETDVSVWGQKEFVIYTIFDVVVLSVLTELLFRGGIFSALRQFGDTTAIAVTTAMTVLLTGDFFAMPAALLISFVASLGMLRSGTIFTAVIVRIIYKMYQLALIILEVDASENMIITRNLFMISVFVLGLILAASVILTGDRRNKRYIVKYESDFTESRRLAFAIKVFPFSAVSLLCIVQAISALLF